MKKEYADKWVEALRSGEYQQGTGALFNGEGYCCLGVLCKLVGKEFKKESEGPWTGRFKLVDSKDKGAEVLPDDVVKEVGMAGNGGIYESIINSTSITIGGVVHGCLAAANDRGRTFEEIADYIEQNYESL